MSTDTREQIEIERKYDVGEHTAVPSLAGVGAVTSQRVAEPVELRAVYLDTAEHLLLAGRITLRRREGGGDEGWHVKLPAVDGARREVHAPLRDSDGVMEGAGAVSVPQELRDRLEALLRGRPVHPVLVLATRRTATALLGADGAALAEVADDEVTASNPVTGASVSWREWEVELAPGLSRADGEALFDDVAPVLAAAGAAPSSSKSKLARGLAAVTPEAPAAVAAPDTAAAPDAEATPGGAVVALPASPVDAEPGEGTAGAFALGAVARLAARIVELDPAVRSGGDDAVHEFRTALRRLRSVLRVYRSALDAETTDGIGESLAELGALAGVVRDAEVAEEQLAIDAAEAPGGFVDADALARIRARARERAAEAGQRLTAAMRDTPYFELLDRLEALPVAPAGAAAEKSGAKYVAARIAKEVKRARRRAREAVAADGLDLVAAHRARKAARRLRHAIDAERHAGLRGGVSPKAARAVQAALGEALDAAAAATGYVEVADAARRADEDTFAYGVLATVALRRRDEALDALPKLAEKL